MQNVLKAIDWTVANWDKIVMVAGAAYALFDVVIRLVLPTAKVEEIESKGEGLKSKAASLYLICEKIMTFSRQGCQPPVPGPKTPQGK